MEECYEVEVLCKGKRLSGISVGSVAVGDGALLVTGGLVGAFDFVSWAPFRPGREPVLQIAARTLLLFPPTRMSPRLDTVDSHEDCARFRPTALKG